MDEITLLRELCLTNVYVTDIFGEIRNDITDIDRDLYDIYASQFPAAQERIYFGQNHQPSLTSDMCLFFWITVPFYTDGVLQGFYLIGPNTDHVLDDEWMRKMGIRETLIPVLKNLETTSYQSMCRLGEAVYRALNGVYAQIVDRGTASGDLFRPTSSVFYSPNRSYRFERMLCDGIINHLSNDEINDQLKHLAMERYMKNASLRIYADYFIGICYLFSHAAIQAGCIESDAFLLCNDFVVQAESCRSIEEIDKLWGPLRNGFLFYSSSADITSLYSEPVRQLQERIHANLRNRFKLKDLADELGYNPYYLSSLFHKETGETVQQYTNRTRLNQALFYLTFNDMTISEISSLFCFTDQSDFTRKFKNQFHETPKQFRLRRHREMSEELSANKL